MSDYIKQLFSKSPIRRGVPDLNDPTNKDTIPAMLTEGEYVLNKEATQMFKPQIEAMNNAGLQQRHQENAMVMKNMGGPLYLANGGGTTFQGSPKEEWEAYLNDPSTTLEDKKWVIQQLGYSGEQAPKWFQDMVRTAVYKDPKLEEHLARTQDGQFLLQQVEGTNFDPQARHDYLSTFEEQTRAGILNQYEKEAAEKALRDAEISAGQARTRAENRYGNHDPQGGSTYSDFLAQQAAEADARAEEAVSTYGIGENYRGVRAPGQIAGGEDFRDAVDVQNQLFQDRVLDGATDETPSEYGRRKAQEEAIQKEFNLYNPQHDTRVPRPSEVGTYKGPTFQEFADQKAADAVDKYGTGKSPFEDQMAGAGTYVDPYTPTPPSGGGGRGGRKPGAGKEVDIAVPTPRPAPPKRPGGKRPGRNMDEINMKVPEKNNYTGKLSQKKTIGYDKFGRGYDADGNPTLDFKDVSSWIDEIKRDGHFKQNQGGQ